VANYTRNRFKVKLFGYGNGNEANSLFFLQNFKNMILQKLFNDGEHGECKEL